MLRVKNNEKMGTNRALVYGTRSWRGQAVSETYSGYGNLSLFGGDSIVLTNPCDGCTKRERCTTDKMCSQWKAWFRSFWREMQEVWQDLAKR